MSEVQRFVMVDPQDYITVAAGWMESAVTRFAEDSLWESYPDIGEHDLARIERIMFGLIPRYERAEFEAAYKRFAEMAQDVPAFRYNPDAMHWGDK